MSKDFSSNGLFVEDFSSKDIWSKDVSSKDIWSKDFLSKVTRIVELTIYSPIAYIYRQWENK
jgi:hypothetical protein